MNKYAYYNGSLSMGYYDNTMPGVDSYGMGAAICPGRQLLLFSDEQCTGGQSYMVAASDNNFPWSVQPYYGPCQKPDAAAKPFGFPTLADQMNNHKLSWGWFAENYGACGGGYLPCRIHSNSLPAPITPRTSRA